jgi:hypothetical protein
MMTRKICGKQKHPVKVKHILKLINKYKSNNNNNNNNNNNSSSSNNNNNNNNNNDT